MIFQIGNQYHIRYNGEMRHIAVRETHYNPAHYMASYIVAWDFTRNAYRSFTIGKIIVAIPVYRNSYSAVPE